MALTNKRVVYSAIIAALYAVLTLAIAPLSFGPLQFRVSEALKVLVLLDPLYSIGIGLGTLIANIASPFVGPWDLAWMPLTDIAGGFLAWGLFRVIRSWSIVPSLILYALTTGAAVGVMLYAFGLGAWWIVALPVTGSELIILLVGGSMIWKGLTWIGQR